MINIEKISKRFGRQKVLKDISLTFTEGQSVALIGPNGSGKTTLIKSILGLVLPDSGSIEVNHKNIRESPQYRKDIGYMPQLSRFPERMKVKHLFSLIQNIRKEKPANGYDQSLYDDFNIAGMEHKALGALSGGMKQQVSAALAFYFRPKIIILDEPTAGLDPLSNEVLISKINQAVKENRLLITTSHILSDLDEICNHVVYLMGGKVLFNKGKSEIEYQTGETRMNKMIVKLLKSKSGNE